MSVHANAVVTAFKLEEGIKATRKMLKTFFNDGTTVAPVWELLGKGVEESSIEYSPDTETVTDITGVTSTTVNALETTQSLEPMTVTGGQKLPLRLEDIIARNALGEFAVMEVMVVKDYISGTAANSVYAEVHKNCTIYPTSVGGGATVDMPIEITFSNDKTVGSVTYDASGVPTFVAKSDETP